MDPDGTARGLAIAATVAQVMVLLYCWVILLPPYVYTYPMFIAPTIIQTVGFILAIAGIACVTPARRVLASACFFLSGILNLLSVFSFNFLSVYTAFSGFAHCRWHRNA